MTIQDINNAIRNQAAIGRLNKEDLITLVKKYPYCSTLHLLLIKHLHVHNSPDYQNQLAYAAAYANDRKALFRLIYESGSVKDSGSSISPQDFNEHFSESVTTLLNQGADVDTSSKAYDAQIENESREAPENSESRALEELEAERNEQIVATIQDELATWSETGAGEVLMNEQVEEENEEELVDEHTDPEMLSVANIEHELIEHDINEAVKEKDIELLSESLAAIEPVLSDNPISSSDEHSAEMESIAQIEQTIASQLPDESSNLESSSSPTAAPSKTSTKKSFSDWLKSLSSSTIHQITTPPKEPQKIQPQNTSTSLELQIENHSGSDELNILNDQYREEQALVYFKETEEDLNKIIEEEIKHIDEFVQTQADVAPIKNESLDISVAELARRSLDDSQEIITETMARVFAAQGKFKRAIDILQKLELLHPEKRLYFAALIEEFKKQNI